MSRWPARLIVKEKLHAFFSTDFFFFFFAGKPEH